MFKNNASSNFDEIMLGYLTRAALLIQRIGPQGPQGPTTVISGDNTGGGGIKMIFYDATETVLEVYDADNGGVDNNVVSTFDLGVVPGPSCEDTVAVVKASLTSRIIISVDEFDDYDSAAGLGAVYLEILAYSGCTDAVSCAAVTPTALLPGKIPIHAVNMAVDMGDQQDSTLLNDYLSTDQANFVLAGKGSGDFFLQGQISIYAAAESVHRGKGGIDDIKLPYDDIVFRRNRKLSEVTNVTVTLDNYMAVVSSPQNAATAPSPTENPTDAPISPTDAPIAPTDAPIAPAVCATWCEANISPWSTKCFWANCGGCSPCFPATPAPISPTDAPIAPAVCATWCEANTSPWSSKCFWVNCVGCSSCLL